MAQSITVTGARSVKTGTYKGRPVYRVPVLISIHNPADWREPAREEHCVLAHSAAEAANWVRDHLVASPQTTIVAFGPQGGKTERYVGWETFIGNQVFDPVARAQQCLPF
jgi:hypothetical protein